MLAKLTRSIIKHEQSPTLHSEHVLLQLTHLTQECEH